jgi:hypothetical protein
MRPALRTAIEKERQCRHKSQQGEKPHHRRNEQRMKDEALRIERPDAGDTGRHRDRQDRAGALEQALRHAKARRACVLQARERRAHGDDAGDTRLESGVQACHGGQRDGTAMAVGHNRVRDVSRLQRRPKLLLERENRALPRCE